MRNKLLVLAMVMVNILIVASLVACSGSKSSPATQSQAKPPAPSASPGIPSLPAGAKPGLPSPPAPTAAAPVAPAKTVSGDGVVSVANYANLYFGSAGQIEKINVKAGDPVTKGASLASLDTTSLEASLAQARVNLDQAQLVQAQALVALDQANLSRIQAESALTTAQYNLDKTKAVSDIKDEITDVEWTIKATEVLLNQANQYKDSSSASSLRQNLIVYQRELKKKQDKLATLLSKTEYSGSNALTYDIMGQTYDRLTVEDVRMKQLAVEAAQKAIEQYKNGIVLAQKNIDKSNDGIVLAQTNIKLLQDQLAQATIIAPFDGIIATVNQNENDSVPAPAQSQKPIIYMVDLNTMQLNIAVNELDMPKVKPGQKASIRFSAFPDIKLDGKVSTILPLPTVQGGIVDYTVTVSFSTPSTVNIMIGMHATASISVD